jgi:hypothetical protein
MSMAPEVVIGLPQSLATQWEWATAAAGRPHREPGRPRSLAQPLAAPARCEVRRSERRRSARRRALHRQIRVFRRPYAASRQRRCQVKLVSEFVFRSPQTLDGTQREVADLTGPALGSN